MSQSKVPFYSYSASSLDRSFLSLVRQKSLASPANRLLRFDRLPPYIIRNIRQVTLVRKNRRNVFNLPN
jgi:hypothetical protein